METELAIGCHGTMNLHVFRPVVVNSNSGGGGERVLWCAIKCLEEMCSESLPLSVVIYTGDIDASPGDIFEKTRVSPLILGEQDVIITLALVTLQPQSVRNVLELVLPAKCLLSLCT